MGAFARACESAFSDARSFGSSAVYAFAQMRGIFEKPGLADLRVRTALRLFSKSSVLPKFFGRHARETHRATLRLCRHAFARDRIEFGPYRRKERHENRYEAAHP